MGVELSKIWLACYATADFYPSAVRLCVSAYRYGIDHICLYTPASLPEAFIAKHKNMFAYKRGAGYWIWKPQIILQTMQQAAEDDIIIYADSGIDILASLQLLIELAHQKGIVLFSAEPYVQREWTKRDAFVLLDADSPKYWNDEHIWGGFQIYKNNQRSKRFVSEWLQSMSDERAVTDSPNEMGKPNFPGFQEHRHDHDMDFYFYRAAATA